MTDKILDYKEINPESLVFEPPKKVKGGSYMAEIKYRTSEGEDVPFIIQTPRLISSEGIVRNDTRAHCELEFDKNHWPFYEFITNIDDHNIVVIEKFSEQWFTSKFPIDVVEEFYKTPVKLGRGKNPPKLKVKIPINRGEISCNIYDNVKNSINYTEVKKNNKVVCVLHLQGLRFLKQQVICEWVPLQIKVCKESVKKQMDYIINDTLLSDYEDNLDVEEQSESTVEKVPEPEQPLEQAQVQPESTVEQEKVQEPVSELEQQLEQAPVQEPEQEPEPEPHQEQPLEQEPEQEQPLEQAQVQEPEPEPEQPSEQVQEPEQEPVLSFMPDMELDINELESIDLSNISNVSEEQPTELQKEESDIIVSDKNQQEQVTQIENLIQNQEQVEETLESRLENLNNQLTEKNRLIDQMKSLLMN